MKNAAEKIIAIEEETRMPGPVFKFVEYKLYHYRQNLAAINALEESRKDILLRGRQWEPGFIPVMDGSSPVEKKSVQLVLLEEKVTREVFWVRAISDVMSALPAEDQRLVELKYFDGFLTNAGVARELRISEATYYRRRDMIMRKFAERFGLV